MLRTVKWLALAGLCVVVVGCSSGHKDEMPTQTTAAPGRGAMKAEGGGESLKPPPREK